MNCINCNSNCNKLCPNYVISSSISVVTVDGTDTLLINIPDGTYSANHCYCIITAQTIPTTATVNMPVAISIASNTTTVYPLICSKTGLQAVACQVNTRTRYKVIVRTGATTGSFVALSGLGSCFVNTLTSLPVSTTTTTTDTEVVTFNVTPTASTTKTKSTSTKTKEVSSDE